MFGKVINFVKRVLGSGTKEEVIVAPYKVETPEVEEKPTPKFGTTVPITPDWQAWTVSADVPITAVAPVKEEKEEKKSADIVEFPKKPRAPKKPKNEFAANDPAPKNARKPRNTTTNKNTPPKVVPVKAAPAPKPTKPKKK